ncbi:MAG: MFS transporter [Candidatus Poribacteria bacterium]|nr:MFS transporter [Candidatus Poribacteria bacterium]
MRGSSANITKFYVSSALGGFTLFHGVLGFYMRQIGFSYTQIFFLAALYEILVFLLEIPTGVFADRFGLKKCAVLGHFISAASCFPIALFPTSYSVFLLWSLLSAISTTLNSGSVEALQFESLRDISREAEYTKLRGRLAAIGGLSMPVGAFIGGILCENIGFGRVAALGGLTGLFIAAVYVSMNEPIEVQLARESLTAQSIFKRIAENFRFIKKDRELTGVIIAGAVVYAAYLLINNYSQPCLEEAGIQSYRIVGLVSGTFMLAFAAVSWWAGYLTQRIGAKGIFLWLSGVPILSLVGLGKLKGTTLLAPLYLSRLGEGVAEPVISNRLLQKSPVGKSATLLSTHSLLTSLVFSIWSMASGYGLDNVGRFLTFSAGAAIALMIMIWNGRWVVRTNDLNSPNQAGY